jgi:hypothetical protein
MGLLHRAAAKEKAALDYAVISELDDMGQALAERILRLPRSASRAESALNLLKPYISCQSGFCSSLNGEAYVPYAAAGIDRTEAVLNTKDLAPLKKGFAKVSAPAPFRLWAFPLENNSALFLNENPAKAFNPSLTGALLEKIKPALLPPEKSSKIQQLKKEVEFEADNTLEDLVSAYYRNNGPFHLLILCRDDGQGSSGADFCRTLSHSLSFGEVIPVKDDTCLLLFPKPLNPMLVSHRLSKSFGAKALLRFEASGIREALTCIQNYLKA